MDDGGFLSSVFAGQGSRSLFAVRLAAGLSLREGILLVFGPLP